LSLIIFERKLRIIVSLNDTRVHMKTRILLYLLLFLSLPLKAQVDSLRQVWLNTEEADTNRLKALNHLVQQAYIFVNPDSARILCYQGIALADDKGLKRQKTSLLNMVGISYSLQADYENALRVYNQNLQLYAELNNISGIGKSYNNMGLAYTNKGDYADALYCYDRCLDVATYLQDTGGISAAYQNLGGVYNYLGEYDKALELYDNALKLEGDRASYHTRGSVHNAIGAVLSMKEKFDTALYHYQLGYSFYTAGGEFPAMANSLHNIGANYRELGFYDSALVYLNRASELETALNLGSQHCFTLSGIGSTYYMMGQLNKAITTVYEAYDLATLLGVKEVIKETSGNLKMMLAESGRYKEAYQMAEVYLATKDTLEKKENQKALIKQQLESDYEKQQELANAEHQMEIDRQATIALADKQQRDLVIVFVCIGFLLVVVFCIFLFNRFRVIRKQKAIIEAQKQVVEHKNKEVHDSITYARRIQKAIFPTQRLVSEWLPDSFILYKPKDIVAGDFYWMEKKDDRVLFAAADCTGHGVPGAMVSVVCNNSLNRTVREHGLTEPAQILDKTREIVISEFEKSEDEVKDGMDISLCSLSLSALTLTWAGANNPLWIIRNSNSNPELLEIKPDKQPIGKYQESKPFTGHNVKLEKGDLIYIFTDGLQDQFGGEKGKKFKASSFKTLLLQVCQKSMAEQRKLVKESFEQWRGDFEQLDDICVIGVRV
jgi:serine phosphatase RsbU (regulator of sigma subunit)/tetratricopeptide (TPR) repeat protein